VESLQTGGLERLVHDLVVARQADTRVVCLYALGQFGEALRDQGFPVHLVGKSGFPRLIWRLRCTFQHLRPDVVHCHNLFPFLTGSLAAKSLGRVPTVMTKHGAKLPDRGYGRRVIRRMLCRSYAVGVSQEATGLLNAWMLPGSRPARFIPNGIATEPYDNLPPREEARAQLHLPSASFIAGIVARVAFCKGHLILLEAFARLLAHQPDALLLIVGDGPKLAEVKSRIQELEIGRSVLVLGGRRDIPTLLAALDVFCLPSEMEGMPMTVFEAMAARLPVIATEVGGIPGMVDHGRTGILIPPRAVDPLAAALLDLSAQPDRAREMGLFGQQKLLSEFSLRHTVDAYEACYREAMDGRTRGMGRTELS
jgi:glycosyltransferase involved in cell wall biosynthesis